MEYTKDYWVGWLGGFADGEGCVSYNPKGIIITNTVLGLLLHYQTGLNVLGVYSRLRGPYQSRNPKHKPVYRLAIQRQKDIVLWAELVGFQDLTKQANIQRLVDRQLKCSN